MSFGETILEIDITQVEKFAEQIELELSRSVLEKAANRIMGEWYERVVELSPVADVDGGTLRDSWEVSPIKREGDMLIIDIWNTAVTDDGAPYPIYVEFGHRQEVGRYVPAIGKRLVRAWIPGQAFFRNSRDEIEQKMEQILEEVVREVWESL